MASLSHRLRVAFLAFTLGLLAVSGAGAQTLGTFKWQLQPYCNVVTLTVTQEGAVYRLDGFDDLCGSALRASAVGMAFPNPDGTIGIGLSIVMADSGRPLHVDARISPATLSGTWRDSDFGVGTFAFGASESGSLRQPTGNVLSASANTHAAVVVGRYNGTREAPTSVLNDQQIGVIALAGQADDVFLRPGAYIVARATEDWSATASGTRLELFTTANGDNVSRKMTIDHSGNVGIGVVSPLDPLHVRGNIRVGTSGTDGCLKNNNGGQLIGNCASDRRFKRDIASYSSMLDRVARLRPVHFNWRATEFADRGFGSAREDGLIAQEVEEVLPELVTTDADGYKAVDYSKLPLLAIQAIKELKAENDALKRQFEARHTDLLQRLAVLEAGRESGLAVRRVASKEDR